MPNGTNRGTTVRSSDMSCYSEDGGRWGYVLMQSPRPRQIARLTTGKIVKTVHLMFPISQQVTTIGIEYLS